MPELLSENVLGRLDGAEALYHRLILVAAPSGSGKTEALREVAASTGARLGGWRWAGSPSRPGFQFWGRKLLDEHATDDLRGKLDAAKDSSSRFKPSRRPVRSRTFLTVAKTWWLSEPAWMLSERSKP